MVGSQPQPHGDLTTMGYADLTAEVLRLRGLLDSEGVAW
jgi:hypothetical protein